MDVLQGQVIAALQSYYNIAVFTWCPEASFHHNKAFVVLNAKLAGLKEGENSIGFLFLDHFSVSMVVYEVATSCIIFYGKVRQVTF